MNFLELFILFLYLRRDRAREFEFGQFYILQDWYAGDADKAAQAAFHAGIEIVEIGAVLILSGFQKPDQQVDRHVGGAGPDALAAVDAGVIAAHDDIPAALNHDGVGSLLSITVTVFSTGRLPEEKAWPMAATASARIR
jgi:hypothetical protein